jgi:hypothetical protein
MVDLSTAAKRRLGNFKVNKGTPVATGNPALRKNNTDSPGGIPGAESEDGDGSVANTSPLAQAIRNKAVKKL